ncbi:hypothetical protein ACO2Q8_16130 [Larkinella sp. VNQ87]|uniref:hypothetical protein n=1 Tax=Larkinella sp. VNQ87 TaxID=3400921 RepID=UPI003C0EF89D
MEELPKTDEEIHRDAIGLETKPELMNPADNPQEDPGDSLEPEPGTDTHDTEPGTGLAIENAGSR